MAIDILHNEDHSLNHLDLGSIEVLEQAMGSQTSLYALRATFGILRLAKVRRKAAMSAAEDKPIIGQSPIFAVIALQP